MFHGLGLRVSSKMTFAGKLGESLKRLGGHVVTPKASPSCINRHCVPTASAWPCRVESTRTAKDQPQLRRNQIAFSTGVPRPSRLVDQ